MLADLPNSSLHVDINNPRQLQAIANQIQQAIITAPLIDPWLDELMQVIHQWRTPAVILRPSLSLRHHREVKCSQLARGLLGAWVGPGDGEGIVQGIRNMWARAYQATALLYWQQQGIQLQHLNLAILVQPIQDAIASGELYIYNDHLEIAAIQGLGSAMVHGLAQPDRYHMNLYNPAQREQHRIAQAYCYELPKIWADLGADTPAQDPSQKNLGDLQLTPLTSAMQGNAGLSEIQLTQLTQLARAIAHEVEANVGLEWTIPGTLTATVTATTTPEQSPPVQITQIIPQPHRPHVWALNPQTKPEPDLQSTITFAEHPSAPHSDAHEPDDIATSPPTTPKPTSPASPFSELPTVALTVMGIAASPGKVMAPAWFLPDLYPGDLPPGNQTSGNQTPGDLAPEEQIPDGAILITPTISPDHLPWLQKAGGIVTQQGGMTSHGAIIARELGVPAVVGVPKAMDLIQPGDVLFLDGDRGLVYQLDEGHIPPELERQLQEQQRGGRLTPPSQENAVLHYQSATQLMVNLSRVEGLATFDASSVDGIGLLRSEILLRDLLQSYNGNWHQSQAELTEAIANRITRFTQAMAPRPVFYRTLDLRSHEIAALHHASPVMEINPTLGMHGTLSYQQDSTLFEIELAALHQVQQQGYRNLRLVLPFVRTVEEFQLCYHLATQAGLTRDLQFQVWIMAEVPSILFLLPDYVQAGVQGISIGSNDLAQLLLAMDRDHPAMNGADISHHPAVLRAIQQLIRQAHEQGISCSICGQAPAQSPDLVERLVRWGIHSISVSPDAIAHTARIIARSEQAMLMESVRHLKRDPR